MRILIGKILKNLFRIFGIEIFFLAEIDLYKNICNAYEALLNENKKKNKTDIKCYGIVFSKDRCMQLHALLCSYFEKVSHSKPLFILYTCSNERHEKSYNKLITTFRNQSVTFIKETSFRKDLIDIIENNPADKLFFMTDDAIYLDNVDFNEIIKYDASKYIFTLNKGVDLTWSNTYAMEEELPEFIEESNENIKIWKWSQPQNSPDWQYPLSVDGYFYNYNEIKVLLNHIPFKAPNSLEGMLQVYINIFKTRYGVCYSKAKMSNIPVNLVNNEIKNLSTGLHSAEELLSKWENGYRIKYEDFYGRLADDALKSGYSFVPRSQ